MAYSSSQRNTSPPFMRVFMLGMCLGAMVWIQVSQSQCLIVGSQCWKSINQFATGILEIDDIKAAKQLTSFFAMPKSDKTPLTIMTTKEDGERCECDLMSVDCLSSIKCIPEGYNAEQRIALGIWTRRIIKETARFEGESAPYVDLPLGKITQYTTTNQWQSWTESNTLPFQYPHIEDTFIDSTRYNSCVERNLVGKNCFFAPLNSAEDMDPMETAAMTKFSMPARMKKILSNDITRYRKASRGRKANALPALGHLLSIAHMIRIRFNRQYALRSIFDSRIQSYGKQIVDDKRKLKVSLHLRRADSCWHQKDGYELEPWALDSPPQMSSTRVCYDTSVYMKALLRVEEMTGRPIEVYLSTDHAGSVLEEIRTQYTDVYDRMGWKVLEYNRDIFNYDTMIEEPGHGKHGILGESAIADLWLLGHGEVFIGHLGSRFGKMGWLLATARHNRFIPFLSVDGHSYCCEVDERCSDQRPYITGMENCMTFNHELIGWTRGITTNSDYWEVGSTVRRKVYEMDNTKKRRRKRKRRTEQ